MRNNCDILDLKIFLAVLDLRSLAQAASELNMTQSAIGRCQSDGIP